MLKFTQICRKSSRLFIAGILFWLCTFYAIAQTPDLSERISVEYYNISLEEVLKDLTNKTGIKFSYSSKSINISQKIDLSAENIILSDILNAIFQQANIDFELISNYVVLKKAEEIPVEETEPVINFVTISGYIFDAMNKETMIGATVYNPETMIGVMTNNYGFYSLTIPDGEFTLEASYLGYAIHRKKFNVHNNMVWNVNLEQKATIVEEVEISSIDREQEIFKSLSAQTNIKSFEVEKYTSVMGESDVLKMLNNLPSISFHNDGSSYFYVRGGHRDQNLIILDEATLYSPSHLFGIFTPIIPDAVKHTEVYKADFPIQYGGRLSSVVDIRTRDGNMEKFSGSVGLGLITSRWTIEGPFTGNKSSYFASFRRSHFGLLVKQLDPNIQDFFFNDLTTKFNIRLTDKDRLFMTFYYGKDLFLNKANDNIEGLEWGNTSLTLRWNHIYGSNLFMNTTFYASKYDYFLHTDYDSDLYWISHISSANLKTEYTYYYNPDNKFKFGFNLGGYDFNPGNYNNENFPLRYSVSRMNSGEFIAYAGNEHSITNWFRINYGIRFSNWSDYGEATIINYNSDYTVDTIQKYEQGTKFYSKNFWEPRISFSFRTGPFASFKLSYNRSIQNINLINNSISPFNTLEVWLPSGPNIRPQNAHIYNLGFVSTFKKTNIDFSIDVYYKKLNNQVGYSYHADLLLNPLLEGELRQGTGTAYGFEIMMKRQTGILTGQLSFAYTRSFLLIQDLNNDRRFPSHQDKPIDLSLLLNYMAKPRITLNTNIIYASGMRLTTPTSFYSYRGDQVPLYTKQNNSKLPDYKRVDIGATFSLNKVASNIKQTLDISVFNFFGFQNAAFLNFNKIYQDAKYIVPGDKKNESEQVPTYRYIYSVVPSITYNVSF